MPTSVLPSWIALLQGRALLLSMLIFTPPALVPDGSVLAQGTSSKWTSFRPRTSIRPLMANTGFQPGFQPGRYMIYVGNADPAGMTVGEWQANGPIVLQPGDKWLATLLPQSGLRLERDPAILLNYGKPTGGLSQIYTASEDSASWQAICVLPVGIDPRPNCFGGSSNITDVGKPGTFSRWESFTPDPRQFGGQPGGVWPLKVVGYPHFVAGEYMIYVASSGAAGLSISTWNSFGPVKLLGGDKWQATLRPRAQVVMERNPATLTAYPAPDSHHAMIYARNEDRSVWQAICVLPIGMAVQTSCFGGSSLVTFAPAKKKIDLEGALHGRYRGNVTTYKVMQTDKPPVSQSGKIELAVQDGAVTGTLTSSDRMYQLTARLSGRIDGNHFVANLEGNSQYVGASGSQGAAGAVENVMRYWFEFPFRGQISGTFQSGIWTGKYEAKSTDQRPKPTALTGTWNAGPEP